MLMDTVIHDFLLYLEAELGYSAHTAVSYRSDLCLISQFIAQQRLTASAGSDEHVESSQPVHVHQITTDLVRAWIVDMKERGLSNNTTARRIHALRSFWRYLLDTDIVDYDPLRKVSTPRRVRPVPTYLRADELRAILDAAQRYRDVLIAFRNYALMAVLIYTGIRRGELINLRLGDVDLQNRLLRINGKGGRWRVVPLAEEAYAALSDWLELRPADCAHDYVFTTARKNRIHPSRMQRIWQSILARTDIKREGITLHTLRHSCATLLLQTGTCDIVQIQQLLGHSRLDTTAIYLHLEPHDLRAAMAVHPLGQSSE